MKRNTSLKPAGVQGLINTYESCRNQREKVVGRWCDAQRVGGGLLRPSCWLYFCDKTSGISNNNKSRGEGGGVGKNTQLLVPELPRASPGVHRGGPGLAPQKSHPPPESRNKRTPQKTLNPRSLRERIRGKGCKSFQTTLGLVGGIKAISAHI